jgi:hypothetical protein
MERFDVQVELELIGDKCKKLAHRRFSLRFMISMQVYKRHDRYRRVPKRTTLSSPRPYSPGRLGPHAYLSIGTRTDQPGFRRVPLDVQHAEPVLDVVPTQDFERDDQRVLHEVRVDGPVEDLDRAVVRSRSEEGIRSVVNDGSESLGVVSADSTSRVSHAAIAIDSICRP